MAPIQTKLIERDLMTPADIHWLNDYHTKVGYVCIYVTRLYVCVYVHNPSQNGHLGTFIPSHVMCSIPRCGDAFHPCKNAVWSHCITHARLVHETGACRPPSSPQRRSVGHQLPAAGDRGHIMRQRKKKERKRRKRGTVIKLYCRRTKERAI